MPVDIKTAVREFVVENFLYRDGAEGLADTDSFLEGGLIDSTGVLELVTFLESSFGIRISDPEVVPENLDSVERVAAFVRRKRGAVSNARDEVVAHGR